MHRALLLPEIVATILQTNSTVPGFLHTCLFISKTFSLEACRLLWKECGANCYLSPDIFHLAQIVSQDARRAQFYANFIHTLDFSSVEDTDDEMVDEAIWHKDLASLQFPKLERFTLGESANATELNTGDSIVRYVQPNIECFTVSQGSGLTDSFLDTLGHSCSRLRVLELSKIDQNSISKSGLVRFLTKANSLKWLIIRTGIHDSWSYEAFEAIAKLPNLSHIEIPDIQDNWVQSIYRTNPSTPVFPGLEDLGTGISDNELECLAHNVPNLDNLVIGLQTMPPSQHILASASKFTHLTDLKVKFGLEDRVSANDLLALVRNCRSLTTLSIGFTDSDSRYRPSSFDINDDVIDEVSQILGETIQDLTITLNPPDLRTWRSILSFAQHCKNLLSLTISCNFNWQETMSGTPEYIFPELERLDLLFNRSTRDSQEMEYTEEMIQSCARRMFEFAPKLSMLWTIGGNLADAYWESTVMKIFYENWTASEIVET